MTDDYLSTSAFQLRRALDDINRGVYDTIHRAPERYERGGVGEVVFGSPAWEALQVASQARVPVPVSVRLPKADGGSLPYFAQGNDDVEAALHIASQPKVRYDEGPQPGEQQLRAYEPTLRERAAQWLTGDAPTPERERFVQGFTGSTGLGHGMGIADFVPGVGQAFQMQEAARAGDNKSMAMAMLPGVPKGAGTVEQQMLKGYQRQLTPLGLYSHAAEAAANLPQAKGTYEQMMAMLRKAGVRDEELRWAGVQEALGNKPVVTQEELAKHFHDKLPQLQETIIKDLSAQEEQLANSLAHDIHGRPYDDLSPEEQDDVLMAMVDHLMPEPKYAEYVLPGGENYREVVLGLPKNDPATALDDVAMRQFGRPYDRLSGALKADVQNVVNAKYRNENYKSPHWDGIPNPVAHLRMADRTGPDGEKILHIEELQSDWAKEGQKKGFGEPIADEIRQHASDVFAKVAKQDPNSAASKGLGVWGSGWNPVAVAESKWLSQGLIDESDVQALKAYQKSLGNSLKTPSAPYVAGGKNDWLDLALKRALREAAAGGYDKMVWTPGEAQAARYDLSKQVDRVRYNPTTNQLDALDKNGSWVLNKQVPAKDLSDYIGKDAADKLLKTEIADSGHHELAGEDLKVGGEGMKTFYDKVVPSQLSKILKKLDPEVKVGKHPMRALSNEASDVRGMSVDEQRRLLDDPKFSVGVDVHSIPITPRMRENILKGLPAYAAGGAVTDPADDALRLAASHRGTKK